ncbi:MAG: hypothetical protein ACRDNZ_19130 [Streptosporangiaceae bacterium]
MPLAAAPESSAIVVALSSCADASSVPGHPGAQALDARHPGAQAHDAGDANANANVPGTRAGRSVRAGHSVRAGRDGRAGMR